MSYILEAIKKADRKRKLGEVPDLQADHNIAMEESGKRALWPYLLALLLFFNAGAILWWLEPWDKEDGKDLAVVEQPGLEEKSGPVPEVKADKSDADITAQAEKYRGDEVAKALEDSSLPDSGPLDDVAVEKQTSLTPASESEQQLGAGMAADKNGALLPEVKEVQEVADSQAADKLADADAVSSELKEGETGPEIAATAPEEIKEEGAVELEDPLEDMAEADNFEGEEESDNDTREEIKHESFDISKVPFVYQLPSSIQDKIPEIKISFHSYTFRPATRMVRINGRILREGQDLTKEIKLEKIVPSGAVLLIDKNRFRVDV